MLKERRVVTNFCYGCSPFGLASSLALSITAALSHKPPPWGCQQESSLQGGIQTQRQENIHVLAHTHTNTQKHFLPILTPQQVHTLFFTFFLFASLTHTHSLSSPGIRFFHRAAGCWRGWLYGRAASLSSDWISDQYLVPPMASWFRLDRLLPKTLSYWFVGLSLLETSACYLRNSDRSLLKGHKHCSIYYSWMMA